MIGIRCDIAVEMGQVMGSVSSGRFTDWLLQSFESKDNPGEDANAHPVTASEVVCPTHISKTKVHLSEEVE